MKDAMKIGAGIALALAAAGGLGVLAVRVVYGIIPIAGIALAIALTGAALGAFLWLTNEGVEGRLPGQWNHKEREP